MWLFVFSIAAVISVIAIEYVYAAGDCPTRWGEPIGIGCYSAAEATTVEVTEVVTDEEVFARCPTRWGEPVGVGCREAYTMKTVAIEEQPAVEEVLPGCPTRWGEPVGVGCRTPY